MDISAHLAARGGATTAAALRGIGASETQIAAAVRRGALVPIRRGAYVAPTSDPARRHVLGCIAVARTRPGEALCHLSALAARGLPLYRFPTTIHLARTGLERSVGRPPLVLLRPLDSEVLALPSWPDVNAVTVAAALVQVALSEPAEAAVVPADQALRTGLITTQDLHQALVQARQRRGAATAERTLSLVDGRSESPGESVLRLLLGELRIVTTPQVELYGRNGFVARVDLLDEATRTVWEFDGAVKYDGIDGRRALVEEKRREDRIRALGYRVVRVMWRDLEPRRLWELASHAIAA